MTSPEPSAEPPADEFMELELDLAPGMEPEEGVSAHRRVKRSAIAQGGEVPQGWKATSREPIPVTRCAHIFKDTHPRAGDRCGRWSLRGSRLCYIHSGRGNLKHVEEFRQAVIDAARLELAGAVPDAVQGLIDLAANSGADNVRLKAITEILDRNGIRGGTEVSVSLEVTEADPTAALAARLQKLADANLKMQAQRVKAEEEQARLALEAGTSTRSVIDDGSDVIDGEVVEEPGE